MSFHNEYLQFCLQLKLDQSKMSKLRSPVNNEQKMLRPKKNLLHFEANTIEMRRYFGDIVGDSEYKTTLICLQSSKS